MFSSGDPAYLLKEGKSLADIEEVHSGDLLWLATFSLGELKGFHNETTKHLGSRLAGLEADDDERHYLAGVMEVKGILDLVQNFGVVGVYRTAGGSDLQAGCR